MAKLTGESCLEEYFRLALSVENKWGNTKFLLSQLMPGKSPLYQKVQMSKSYNECASILELTDSDLIAKSAEVDHILSLDVPKVTQRDMKRENKRLNKERQQAKIAKKHERALEQSRHQQRQKRSRSPSIERSKKQKAEIAAENAGFEGVGRGALAVAV